MGYDLVRMDIHNEHFVENFNKANSLLIYLYNQKYNNAAEKCNHRLINSKKSDNITKTLAKKTFIF